MNTDDLQLVLVRYGSDTGLISLAAGAILCHTVDTGDGGLEWPRDIPLVDFSEEDRFTRMLGQNPEEPNHNWEDVLRYVLDHREELESIEQPIAAPCTRVVTMRVACLVEDAEDVRQSLFNSDNQPCWYYDHNCPLGPVQVGIRLPTAAEEEDACEDLDVEEADEKTD